MIRLSVSLRDANLWAWALMLGGLGANALGWYALAFGCFLVAAGLFILILIAAIIRLRELW